MIEQQYINIYNQYKALISRNSVDILNAKRQTAFADFSRLGFPTNKQEDFLYTNLAEWFAPDYGLNLNALNIPVNPYEIFHCGVSGINSHLFFVINDQFYTQNAETRHATSLQNVLPAGILAGSLKQFAQSHPELVAKYYGTIASTDKDGTVAFNTAFAQDGFFLYVPEGVKLEKPIQLINVMRADVDLMANSRNLIIIEKNASAKVLVCGHTIDRKKFLANRVTEVFVGENAHYEHYKLENTSTDMTNIGSLFVRQEANSSVLVNEITLHNGKTRNNVRIDLFGENAETTLCGMAIGDKEQHIDNNTFINHAVANCQSKELYKYVLNDHSHGAFSGKVLVAKDAQKTQALQTNKNICISQDARMNTKPQLEIYADDVKCSHGATVGQLNDEALFYLRTRGISEAEARMLLMFAFVDDVIEHI
ncbi:MAG: Fe-S cluster assembly protein SufD, partial [Bacteroidales bacterium]|nr:Fe-S cluster assembly protein SufD [Bacteroidales bacterium]